jgi:serine/threonine-protein kinase
MDKQPPYLLLDCKGCRATFRVQAGSVGPGSCCALCGEPIMAERNILFLGEWAAPEARAAEAPAPQYVLPARRQFGHFELIRLIGRGGAGRVYEARNRRLGRVVALKMLDFRPLESVAETFQRLRKESRVAAAVIHENIVRVLDLGVAEGVPFIEMELVRGSALSAMVRERGPLAPPEASRICAEALCGLARVHQEKIVHGDIKPGNILVDEQGRARLTDFGISKFLEETTTATSGRRVIGSPHFMAPEQWRGESLSTRTDLYAMGLVLYYALTGLLPYGADSGAALMYKHLHEPLLPPGREHPGVPDCLAEVIRRAAEKEPAARFASAEEFCEALRRCAAQLSGPART